MHLLPTKDWNIIQMYPLILNRKKGIFCLILAWPPEEEVAAENCNENKVSAAALQIARLKQSIRRG
jgi:hypothetical protein